MRSEPQPQETMQPGADQAATGVRLPTSTARNKIQVSRNEIQTNHNEIQAQTQQNQSQTQRNPNCQSLGFIRQDQDISMRYSGLLVDIFASRRQFRKRRVRVDRLGETYSTQF
jgi:hypothetical protein